MTSKPTYEELEQKIKALEEEFAKCKQAKGNLSAKVRSIAHDFNNLLMGIQGYTSLMLLDIDSTHPHYSQLKGIEDYIENAKNSSNELLVFVKSEQKS